MHKTTNTGAPIIPEIIPKNTEHNLKQHHRRQQSINNALEAIKGANPKKSGDIIIALIIRTG